jgi:hypothetical protein
MVLIPYGSFLIKDVSEIRLYEDKWLGNTTLREKYSTMYDIVRHKGDTIAKLLESTTCDIPKIKVCLNRYKY